MEDKVVNSLDHITSHKVLFKVINDFYKESNIQLVDHKNLIDKLESTCNENNIAQSMVSESQQTEADIICSEILERYRVHMQKLLDSITSLKSYIDTRKLEDTETIRDVKKHYQEIVIQRKILFLALKQIPAKSMSKYKKLILEQDIKNYHKITYELHNFS